MDFIDEVSLAVVAGRGGDGCVSFRREKFVPKGGPDGGDGGNGGSVILRASANLSTLLDHKHRKKVKAGAGEHGKGKKMYGRNGTDAVILVPRGTLVYDESGQLLADLTDQDQEYIAARGGRGGRGNTHFATSTRQTPDFAEPGKPGETFRIRMELKLLADVGLVGYPNAGKSTLLSRVSAARPKIADYPFTTLAPQLGIVSHGEYEQFVMADIPGLIEGAHSGRGLGDRFLRHIERTRVLLFLLDAHAGEMEKQYRNLIRELELFNPELLMKKRCAALTKVDLLDDSDRAGLPANLEGTECIPISSVTGEGLKSLIHRVWEMLSGG